MRKFIPGKLYEVETYSYPRINEKYFRYSNIDHNKEQTIVKVRENERVFVMYVGPEKGYEYYVMALYKNKIISIFTSILLDIK